MKPKLTPVEWIRLHCLSMNLPTPTAEHRFTKVRKWAFDLAWVEQKVALEIEGGAFVGGRHTSGAGFIADMDKYNEAAIQGWILLRIVPKQAKTDRVRGLIFRALTRGSV